MTRATRVSNAWMFFAIEALLAICISAFPISSEAQGNPGQNAICTSTSQTGCPTNAGTNAFIDASVFVSGTNPNICAVLFNILNGSLLGHQGYPTAGAVIDARGISGTTALTCATGTTPWNNGTTTVSVPSTILLPGGAIVIPTTWVLPNNTTLIGVGDNLPASTSAASSTTIQACKQSINSCSFTGSDMIDLGTSIVCPL